MGNSENSGQWSVISDQWWKGLSPFNLLSSGQWMEDLADKIKFLISHYSLKRRLNYGYRGK